MSKKKLITKKLEIGTLRQKEVNGPFYFRFQMNGQRREISLKTNILEKAIESARNAMPIMHSNSIETIASHVKDIKNLEKRKQDLSLTHIWDTYSQMPDRAVPHTVEERIKYKNSVEEFVTFAKSSSKNVFYKHVAIRNISEVTPQIVEAYANFIRKTRALSVDTHNRKIKHLRKVFNVLSEYYEGKNPFDSKVLVRNEREERSTKIDRQPFSREQIESIFSTLENLDVRISNRAELRVVFRLGFYTGQRLKDCVLLQWQNVSFEHNRISFIQNKTGKKVSVPIASELQTYLKEAESWKINGYVLPNMAQCYMVCDAKGKNIGSNNINSQVMRIIKKSNIETCQMMPGRKKKSTIYGFHSLRHTFASLCAKGNVPEATLLSILGTDSEIANKFYVHTGTESQNQAIEVVSQTLNPNELKLSTTLKIEKALELLKGAEPTPELLQKLREILEG